MAHQTNSRMKENKTVYFVKKGSVPNRVWRDYLAWQLLTTWEFHASLVHACGVLVCTYSDESGEGTILFFGHKTEKLVVPHKPVAAIGELACCEPRMAERIH